MFLRSTRTARSGDSKEFFFAGEFFPMRDAAETVEEDFPMMKALKMVLPVLACVLGLCLSSPAARAQDDAQPVSEFGDEMCSIMTTIPGDALSLVPLRYVIRVALSNEAGGEDALYEMLDDNGMSIDELIDTALDESGMLEEGAGDEFFGTDPVSNCYWDAPAQESCEDLFTLLEQDGILVGTIPAAYNTLVNAGVEQNLQDCASIRIVADAEDLTAGLLMFDNLWYMVSVWDNKAQ